MTISFNKIRAGFSLIELMIVVAIIGILSAIAIPSYRNYTIQAKVTDLVNNLSNYKKDVEVDFVSNNGTAPANKTFITGSTTDASQFITVAWTQTGQILTATFAANPVVPSELQGKSLQMVATYSTNGNISWVCSSPTSGGVDRKYLPLSCG